MESILQLRKQLYNAVQGTSVQWLRGWWLFNPVQQLCEYEAPSADEIRRVYESSGSAAFIPIVSVEEAFPNGPADIPDEFA